MIQSIFLEGILERPGRDTSFQDMIKPTLNPKPLNPKPKNCSQIGGGGQVEALCVFVGTQNGGLQGIL